MGSRKCPACGSELPEKELEDRDGELGKDRANLADRLPDGTPSELRRFCPPCRQRLMDTT
ncbi:MAG TPA: hypothetical protein VMB50_11595 [Myxococcales bacterium]|nr:hypothetical protein [Myxococcales bacterium]